MVNTQLINQINYHLKPMVNENDGNSSLTIFLNLTVMLADLFLFAPLDIAAQWGTRLEVNKKTICGKVSYNQKH